MSRARVGKHVHRGEKDGKLGWSRVMTMMTMRALAPLKMLKMTRGRMTLQAPHRSTTESQRHGNAIGQSKWMRKSRQQNRMKSSRMGSVRSKLKKVSKARL